MAKLELEFRNKFVKKVDTFNVGNNTTVLTTPPIDEDYWVFRIMLHKEQALVAFPKFMTYGIGFSVEDDWNTNLPYSCDVERIYEHIKHNKKYNEIIKNDCVFAINILKKACDYYKNHEEPETLVVGDFNDFVESFNALMNRVKK